MANDVRQRRRCAGGDGGDGDAEAAVRFSGGGGGGGYFWWCGATNKKLTLLQSYVNNKESTLVGWEAEPYEQVREHLLRIGSTTPATLVMNRRER